MQTEDVPSSIVATLRAFKDAQAGEEKFTLPATGVTVTYPRFRGYDEWAKAQRLAGDDGTMINLYYIVLICRFNGQTLKANDYKELIPSGDHLAISGKLFGNSGPTVDDQGNG